jgi:hypothetical protein
MFNKLGGAFLGLHLPGDTWLRYGSADTTILHRSTV